MFSQSTFQNYLFKFRLEKEIYYLKHNKCDVSEPEADCADNYELSEPEADCDAKEPVR